VLTARLHERVSISAALHLASLAGLWSALQGTVTVSETSSGRARGGGGESDSSYDVDLSPSLGVAMHHGPTHGGVGYTPSLTVRNLDDEQDRTTVVLHTAYANLGWERSGFSANLSQSASIGTQSFTNLILNQPTDPTVMAPPTMSRFDLIPRRETVRVANETTALSLGYAWDHRWHSGLTASYGISGGLDAQAQETLPRFKNATVALTTEYTLSRLDRMGVVVSGGNYRSHRTCEPWAGNAVRPADPDLCTAPPDAMTGVQPEPTIFRDQDYWTASGMGTWNHQFARGIAGELSLGLAFVRARDLEGNTRSTPQFTGNASGTVDLMRTRHDSVVLTFGGSITPVPNILTGSLQQRAQATAGLTSTLDKLHMAFGVDAAQTLPQDARDASRLFGATANVGYSPARLVTISAEYRNFWTSTYLAGPIPRQWTASLLVTVAAPPLTF
jgi:hypothetical protein